jgi:hypothetical protein
MKILSTIKSFLGHPAEDNQIQPTAPPEAPPPATHNVMPVPETALDRDIQTIAAPVSGALPPAAQRSLRALDAACDVLDEAEFKAITNPAQDAESQPPPLSNPGPATTLWKKIKVVKDEKQNAEAIEAEEARRALRAQTEQLQEQNRLEAEKKKHDKIANDKRAEKQRLEKLSSWEENFKLFCGGYDDLSITKSLLVKLIQFDRLHGFIADRAAKVAPLLDAWDVAYDARAKQTRQEFKKRMLEDLDENMQRLREGDSELRPLQSENDFEKQFSIAREQCKQRQDEVAEQFNPVLLEIADALQLAARKLSSETHVREKNEAELIGAHYEPSCVLKRLVAAGFNLRASVEYNWLASKLCSPRTTLFGILDATTKWE